MYNVKISNHIKTGGARPAIPTLPVRDFVIELDKAGFSFNAVVTTWSENLKQQRLVLGTVDTKTGMIDYEKSKYVSLRISPKVQFKAVSDESQSLL